MARNTAALIAVAAIATQATISRGSAACCGSMMPTTSSARLPASVKRCEAAAAMADAQARRGDEHREDEGKPRRHRQRDGDAVAGDGELGRADGAVAVPVMES